MSRSISALSISCRVFKAGESLFDYCVAEFQRNHIEFSQLEGSVLALTSKIMSLAENRLVKKDEVSKIDLVKSEADEFLGEIAMGCSLTIKHGLFIASAGIDESNSFDGSFILYPKDPFKSTQELCQRLKAYYQLKNFAVLLTDSHTTPLRAGVTGITLAHAGFRAVESQVGKEDLFGRKIVMTQVNVADALSAAAVYCMGETSESTPLALLKAPVQFLEDKMENKNEGIIPMKDDLYFPLYKNLIR